MKKVKKAVLFTSALALLPVGLFAQSGYEYNGHTHGSHQISQHYNNHNTYCSWSTDYTQHNMSHHNYTRNDG